MIAVLWCISLLTLKCQCLAVRKGWWNEDTKEVFVHTLFYNMYVLVLPESNSYLNVTTMLGVIAAWTCVVARASSLPQQNLPLSRYLCTCTHTYPRASRPDMSQPHRVRTQMHAYKRPDCCHVCGVNAVLRLPRCVCGADGRRRRARQRGNRGVYTLN